MMCRKGRGSLRKMDILYVFLLFSVQCRIAHAFLWVMILRRQLYFPSCSEDELLTCPSWLNPRLQSPSADPAQTRKCATRTGHSRVLMFMKGKTFIIYNIFMVFFFHRNFRIFSSPKNFPCFHLGFVNVMVQFIGKWAPLSLIKFVHITFF